MSAVDESQLRMILSGDVDDWLEGLPPYQRRHLEQMLATAEPTEVAITWLSNSGHADTAPFGGVRAAGVLFYDNLLLEIQKLFCGGEEYKEERVELVKVGNTGKMLIVAFISTVIAPHVGAAAVIIGPAVALILAVLGRTAAGTVCEGVSKLIAERKESTPPTSPG